MPRRLFVALFVASGLFASSAIAATYYVDFASGDDANTGQNPAQAFQHCPGDRSAAGVARKTRLAAGDVIRFKGGVVYYGSIDISRSGAPGKPITYDGSGDEYGQGPAVIDGSAPLTDLQPCRSAAEAWGNPNYRQIYWTTVPAGANWRTINLCQGEDILPIAQDPNPTDPLFQERPADFVETGFNPPVTLTDLEVRFLGAHEETGNRPLISMFDDSRQSAVIQGLNSGCEVEIRTPEPVTAVEFAITPQPRYGNPKTISFIVDGAEVLRADLAYNPKKAVEQRFELDQPVTFDRLVVKFIAAHADANERVPNWGAVQKIAAYDPDGVNVLRTKRTSVLTHTEYFTQSDPAFYDNALLALFAQPAAVYYKRILDYDPAESRIRVETLAHGQVPYSRGGSFSIANSVRHIDRPGEYATVLDAEPDGRHKIFVWPLRTPGEGDDRLTHGKHAMGLAINRASHVTVQGFAIRKQGWKSGVGVLARGKATDLILRNLSVTNIRGTALAIGVSYVDNVLIDNCRAAENAGHTKGIVVRHGKNVVVRDCQLHRNTSTAVDYYTVTNGVVQNCLLTENKGMHANGLTFYVGCRDILVENNVVLGGNSGFTCQDGENMIIRNNILEGAPAMGLWNGRAFNNIVITNNYLRFTGAPDGAFGAIYGGNGGARGYTIANNIVDGLSGNVLRKAEIHHNVFTQLGPIMSRATLGDNILAEDTDSVVVKTDDGWTLAPNSPAADAGVALSTINAFDIHGVDRRKNAPVDIGPWEVRGRGSMQVTNQKADPHTFGFSFDGYTIGPPMVTGTPGYESLFRPAPGGETLIISALDVTGEGGGRSSKRVSRGFVLNWDHPGHWLEWTVEVATAGPYELVIDHASEMPSARRFFVNGDDVPGLERIDFPATGSWRAFNRKAMPAVLHLREGKNVIRVENVKGSMNFRTLRLIPVTSATPGEPRVVETEGK